MAAKGSFVETIALIAVIDDEAAMRQAVGRLLRSLGHTVTAFASAEAFLIGGDLDRFSCIITDIQMPGLSGIELKQELTLRGVAAPVIMITARTEDSIRDQAMRSGALCFLSKPFDAAQLTACVERALRERIAR